MRKSVVVRLVLVNSLLALSGCSRRCDLDDRKKEQLEPGAQEVLVRASDDAGGRQPEAMPAVSNPRGYANNAWHRVRLTSVGKREG